MTYEEEGATARRIEDLRRELKDLRNRTPLDEARIEELLDEIEELTGSRPGSPHSKLG